MTGRPRVYLAIGIFYEAERLRAAVGSLIEWGFSPGRLRRLVLSEPGSATPPKQPRPMELGLLPPAIFPAASLPAEDHDADLPAACLDAIMAGGFEGEIRRHAEQGATVLVAGTEGSDLHDQCVKVLLRHSLHTVHSQEVGLSV